MAPIKRTAFALLAMATVTGCELLPIEPKAHTTEIETICSVEAEILQRAVDQYNLIAGDGDPPVSEEELVLRRLISGAMINADVRNGKAVPSTSCDPTSTTVAGPTTVPGATVPTPTIVLPAATAPAAPGTAPKWYCDSELSTIKRAVGQFTGTTGRPPASEAELVAAGLLTVESAYFDIAADGSLVAVAGTGC